MNEMMQRFFIWLERNTRSAQERDAERYLSESSDLADLENRLRRLDRGREF